MMKKFVYLFILTIASITFFSCDDDDETIDYVWRDANLEAYEKITKDSDYTLIPVQTGTPSGTYMREIKKGTGTEYPLQTANVKVRYKGYYYEGTVFDPGSSVTDVPVTFTVNGTVRGFSVALQSMVVGDKWEIVIPYDLGYGAADQRDYYGNVTFKGYTTLFFEVELLEIDQYPE